MPRVLAIFSVVLFLLQGLGAARYDAPTYDEPTHLTSGYVFLKTGLYWVDVTAPPLIRSIAALPLLLLPTEFPTDDASWINRDRFAFASRFLFYNRWSGDAMLFIARATLLALGLLLAWVLWLWVGTVAGEWAAAFTLLFLATCPPLLAMGHLVTTDFGFTVFFTAALAAYWLYLEHPSSLSKMCWAGVALASALYSKYTAVILVPIMVILCFLGPSANVDDWKVRLRNGMGAIGIGLLLFLPFVVLKWPVCLAALQTVQHFSKVGWPAFVNGQISKFGSPWYYAMVIAMKTPTVLLLASVLGFVFARRQSLGHYVCYWLGMPALVFIVFVSLGRIPVGVRHILPLYPLLCIAAGVGVAALFKQRGTYRAAAVLLLIGSVVTSVSAYPHYIAYFGEHLGGSSHGIELLSDSNFDWGQELKALAVYLHKQHVGTIYLSYFGAVDPAFYGIHYQGIYSVNAGPLIPDMLVNVGSENKILFAVSATNLQGLYLRKPDALSWLLKRQPMRILGHTMYLYDITRDADAHRQIAAIYQAVGRQDLAKREDEFANAIR